MTDQSPIPDRKVDYASMPVARRGFKIVRPNRPWVNWVGLVGWTVLTAAFVTGCGFLVWGIGLSFFLPYQIILLTMALALFFQAVRNNRKRRAKDVLVYVAHAMRLNLPLPALLWAAQQSETRATARKLDRMRILLEHGSTLSFALMQTAPQLPSRTLRLIGAAERLGQLPTTLTRLVRPKVRTSLATAEHEAFYITYPPTLIFVMAAISSMILIFVIPKFEQIFKDFRIELPAVTKLFITVAGDGTIEPLLGLAALVWLGQVLASCLASTDRTFVGHLLDRVYWSLPIFHQRIHDRGMADLCDTVASATAASWALELALDQAAEIQSNVVLRKRIKQWAAGIRAGQPTAAAASAAKMPRLLVSMLAPVRSDEDLSQVMAFLASHYQSKFNRLEVLLKAAYVPFIVGIMGVAVAFVCLALFEPLVELIKATAHYTRYR